MLDFRNYRIGTRLIMTTVGALSLMVAFVVIALFSLGRITDQVDQLLLGNVHKSELAVAMRVSSLHIAGDVGVAILHEETEKQVAQHKQVEGHWQNYLTAAKQLRAEASVGREKSLLETVGKAEANADAALKKMFELTKAGNRPEIEQHFFAVLLPQLSAWREAIGAYEALLKTANTAVQEEIASLKSTTQTLLFMLIGLAVVVMIPSGLWVTRQITGPLADAVRVADSVASGNLDNAMDLSGKDEPAELMAALHKMQSDLRVRQDNDRAVAQSMARINLALEKVSIPLTISDADNTLVFMNDAARGLWTAMEPALRKKNPAFTVDQMQNHSLVDFFDDEGIKAVYRQKLDQLRTLDVRMCGHQLRVTVVPVLDRDGHYIGRASQWLDRTAEMAVEGDVSALITAASSGDFSRRIDSAGMEGFYKEVADGVNHLMDVNSRSLTDVGAMLARLSHGDLTQKIDAQYSGMLGQVKDDANSTVDNLKEIILSIKQASDSINTAAQEIASGNQDLSGRTEQQASSLEETASSMEELTGTVRQNAENARQANTLASAAQKVAIEGGEVVGKVVETMTAIHQSSSRIADIISVIDGIAFQTNILALNAAVEAARAGEQGRGFAVVATEVRSLAQRSANAAKEIKGLIADSVDKVATGNRLVSQAGATMQEVVAGIQRVARLMTDISEATAEQSEGIEQVSRAVGQMDETTQQNAALVEQAAAAAESLEEQARQLMQAVSVFTLAAQTTAAPVSKPAPASRNVAALPHHVPNKLVFPPSASQDKAPASLPQADDEWAEF